MEELEICCGGVVEELKICCGGMRDLLRGFPHSFDSNWLLVPYPFSFGTIQL